MADDRAQLQAETTVGGQQGIAGHLRAHLAVAQDKVRQDREDRFAGGALDAPDGEPAQANPRVMGVARQAPTLAAAGLMEELKAEGEEEGEDELDKRVGVAQERKVGRLIVEINGEGAVFACHFGGLSHVSSPCRWLSVKRRHREGNALKDQAYGERIGAPPLNPMECGSVDTATTQGSKPSRTKTLIIEYIISL